MPGVDLVVQVAGSVCCVHDHTVVAPGVGLEPTTNGLTVRRSAN